MANFRFLDGLSRKPLVRDVDQNITTGSSKDYGQFDTKRFSRFTGYWSTTGSLTIRFRSAANSGQFAITSLTAANSGVGILDFLNYAQFLSVDITQAMSTTYSLLVTAEPLR